MGFVHWDIKPSNVPDTSVFSVGCNSVNALGERETRDRERERERLRWLLDFFLAIAIASETATGARLVLRVSPDAIGSGNECD